METVAYRRISSVQTPLVITALVLVELVLFALSTRYGIGILPDSTRYMQISPVPYDAPLYSWIINAVHLIGFGYNGAAYWVGMILLVINTITILYILNHLCGDKLALFVPAALLIILSPQYLRAHIVAMSEPLFLFLCLASGLFFWRYITTERIVWLLATAVSLGLCMLARFSAAPLAAALATALLLFGPGQTLRARLRHVLLLGGVSGAIFLSWAVISKIVVGRAVGRSLWFHGNPDLARWQSGLETLSTFMLPSQVPGVIRYVLTFALFLAIVFIVFKAAGRIAGRESFRDRDRLIVLLGLFVFWYLAFLVFAVHVEANLPLNARYLLPVYLALVLLVFAWLGRQSAFIHPALKAATLALVAIFAVAAGARVADDTYNAYRNGVGYQAPRWFSSPTVMSVEGLPADAKIFSNAPDALNYLTGRRAELIPRRFERRTGVEDINNPASAQIEALRQALAKGAYVVFVDHVDWRFYLASEEELRAATGLKLYRQEEDGRIYTAG